MSALDDLPVDAARAGVVLVVVAVAFLLSPLFIAPPRATLLFFEVGIIFLAYVLILVGVNLQFGHAGLVNFGPVAFFAVGGYTAAMLTADAPFEGIGLGFPWPVGLVAGVAAAVVLGAILGASTLRLRDDFLAIVTLAVAEIIHGLVGTFQSITGGSLGLGNIPRPMASLTREGAPNLFATAFLFGALALLAYGVFHRLTESPYGRVLHAIRADERVTATLGKNVFRYKLVVFIYGAALAGFAGAMFAFHLGAVSPGFFTINVTVLVWIGMLIGGAASNRGVIGGLAIIMSFQLLTRFLNEQIPAVTADQFASIRLVLVGLLLMIIIRYRPEGIWGDARELGVDR
ncbi:branched-chain amino acid ABC transporter permease [Salinigranum salinum]|uniref:branched-chain amino acid ABC transporter permease n=1 Tax=Salinigranum salinum TaxID=1364937 RepID=UPI0012609388|nr:branched-chain amino acid ABC transporter permease [Salinigranum salinum]